MRAAGIRSVRHDLPQTTTTDPAVELVRSLGSRAVVAGRSAILGDWIKPGPVVKDAGYNAGNVGDVGPMTIVLLLAQTVDAAERRANA